MNFVDFETCKKSVVSIQPPALIMLAGTPVKFEMIEKGHYAVQVPVLPPEFPGLGSLYNLHCFVQEDYRFAQRSSWYATESEWQIPWVRLGAKPMDSLLKFLALAEDVVNGKAGTMESVSGSKGIARTHTSFDQSSPVKYWTGASISGHFFGSHVDALKGKKYRRHENSTDIRSRAMLNDLEDSLGIGRHSAIEVLSEGKITRGTVQYVEEWHYGFLIRVNLFYADGKTISDRGDCVLLDRNFKLARRNLDGRWLEVTPR